MSITTDNIRRRCKEMMAGLNLTQADVAKAWKGSPSSSVVSLLLRDDEPDLRELESWLSRRYNERMAAQAGYIPHTEVESHE